MDGTDNTPPEPKKMHRRWVGSFLSFLIPGAGLSLSGRKRTGLVWFICFIGFWILKSVLAPIPSIPSVYALGLLAVINVLLACLLLVHSFRAVPRLNVKVWVFILLLAAGLKLSKPLLFRQLAWPFKIPTGGMTPTILTGDHILVQGYAYWFSEPKRGDVIVFRTDAINSPHLPKDQFYIKRIAGLPGEHIEIVRGRLLVNHRPIEGPPVLTNADFAIRFPQTSMFTSVTIPMKCYFVVGDNVTNSFDSRYFGLVPHSSVIGKATKIYWPYERQGDIR